MLACATPLINSRLHKPKCIELAEPSFHATKRNLSCHLTHPDSIAPTIPKVTSVLAVAKHRRPKISIYSHFSTLTDMIVVFCGSIVP